MTPEATDRLYLDIAHRISLESYCTRRKVGCVVVTTAMVTLYGYNGTVSGFDNVCELPNGDTNPATLHAETNALAKALRAGVSTQGATCYVTLSPCVECAKLLIQAGVKRVVYSEQYRCTEGLTILHKAGIVVEQINEETAR